MALKGYVLSELFLNAVADAASLDYKILKFESRVILKIYTLASIMVNGSNGLELQIRICSDFVEFSKPCIKVYFAFRLVVWLQFHRYSSTSIDLTDSSVYSENKNMKDLKEIDRG